MRRRQVEFREAEDRLRRMLHPAWRATRRLLLVGLVGREKRKLGSERWRDKGRDDEKAQNWRGEEEGKREKKPKRFF